MAKKDLATLLAKMRKLGEAGLHEINKAADPAELERMANSVGFPLIIKASAGGGGRGMP